MKLSSVGNINYSKNISYKQEDNKNSETKNKTDVQKYVKLPSTSNYLAFMGGYSINLRNTYDNLDLNAYPPDIREAVERELESGNKDDKTLIDIHKEKYSKLNKMKSLDEVKAAFPEFSDVLSDEEIEYKKGTFVDDVKNDKLEWFDSDVDLALQLLQMYWADGFSLNDLKEYTNGKNIASTLEKLNIPRFDKTYGSVLKLSDKEYNERFTKEMSIRRQGVEIKRAEKRDGVYIPRGPLSDEHKKHISEGLIKHYSEHPEKLLEMSQRMKDYYEEHPEEKLRMSRVLTKAWSLPEAKSVRKKMSKFMGKKDISPDEFANMNFDKEKGAKSLADFWQKNNWAKVQWSKAMVKAWDIIKKEDALALEKLKDEKSSPNYVVEIYSESLKADMRNWFRKNGYDLSKFEEKNFQARVKVGDEGWSEDEYNPYAHGAISDYFSREDTVNLRADILQITMFKTFNDLTSISLKELSPKDVKLRQNLLEQLEKTLVTPFGTPGEMTTQQALDIYTKFVTFARFANNEKFAKMFEDNLEFAYSTLLNDNQGDLEEVLKKALLKIQIMRSPKKVPYYN